MKKSPIIIATAQSRISKDVRENGAEIRMLMQQARARGATIVHFPEAALSGYTKSQIRDWDLVDWDALLSEKRTVADCARRLGLWVVVGCNHRLTPPNRPEWRGAGSSSALGIRACPKRTRRGPARVEDRATTRQALA
jgi:predicted amidohydrolase